MAVDADSASPHRATPGAKSGCRQKALWRANPARGGGHRYPLRGLERSQIRALGLLKAPARRSDLRVAWRRKADAIAAAAEIADGQRRPVSRRRLQTGSGTSSNMNTNEVIASIAAGRGRCIQRRREHVAVVQRHPFPTATTSRPPRPRSPHLIPSAAAAARYVAAKALDWHTVGEVGPNASDGRRSDTRPGVQRICPPDRGRHRAGARVWKLASWRSAAAEWYRPQRSDDFGVRVVAVRRPVCRNCVRLNNSSGCATGWWRRPGRCARSRYR